MGRDENATFGKRLVVFGTNYDNPDVGRIFVWTKMGWFERIEGQSGNVAFTPIARSESELRKIISRDDPSADLVQLHGKYEKMVAGEFIDQTPSYLDYPLYSEDDSQQYHQHE